ncbi:MAG: GNAT family N-acetyltransferase [Lachnospiraceae bacterium]|nr:GNAT family N-acetyltransferase [Lachnospiraceae bacterium]
MKVEGAKVYIRETIPSDWEIFAYWEKKPEVTEFFTINEGRDLMEIADEIRGRAEDPTQMDLTICMKSNDAPIGRVYISRIDPHYDSLDITRIYIGEVGLRGMGLGEDAFRTVLKWAFDEMKCERVTLDYMTGNEKAHNLYLKVGLTDEGCMRHGGKKDGHYIDLNLMSILKDEYYR